MFFLGKDGTRLMTLNFSLDRLNINTNTYTSPDLKNALAKFKEGAEMENSKEDQVSNIAYSEFIPSCKMT